MEYNQDMSIETELKSLINSDFSKLSKRSTKIIKHDLTNTKKSHSIFRFFTHMYNKYYSTPGQERIVAGMATMPSRMHTFNLLSGIIPRPSGRYLMI